MAPINNDVVVLSGNTHPELTDSICGRLGLKRSDVTIFRAANRETLITIPDSVRSRDVFIVQTATHTNVNDAIMELLLMGYTCHTSAAKNIICVMPYMPYAKQTRQRKRGAIPSKLLAKLITKAGFRHIVTVDLHHREIQGFFDIPVENLRASSFLIGQIQEMMNERFLNRSEVVIVARNTSSVRKATAYSERLKIDMAVVHGTYGNEPETDAEDGRSSPPPVRSIEFFPGGDSLPVLTCPDAFKRPLSLVGDVQNKIAIMVDNIIDDVDNFITSGHFLKEHGAREVHLMATHANFSREAALKLNEDNAIDHIVVTNTIPHEAQSQACSKIQTIDISILLTETIRRLHNNESLSYLFADVSLED